MGIAIALAILLIAALAAAVLAKIQSRREAEQFAYTSRRGLLSAAERSFYGVLVAAVPEQLVFTKVRVADVIQPAKGLTRSNWQKAFNRISAKHFDFVLCDPDNLHVVAVIELDDRSHHQKTSKQRDALIDAACTSAKIPLIRVKAAKAYNINDIRKQIFEINLESQNREPARRP